MLEKIRILDHSRREEQPKIVKNILISVGFSIFLFALTFVLYLNFSYMGVRNKEIETTIFTNFKGFLFRTNLKIMVVYIVIGLIIGGFSWLLKIKKKRYILLFSMFFWFIFWVRGIKCYPQMFAEQLYRKGGLLKYFQVLITDFIPLVVIFIIFIVTIIAISIKNKRVIYSFVIIFLSSLLVIKFDVSPVKREENKNPPSSPNILICATDSLRPQSISYNGYFRETPNIDGLFSAGVNFLNAKSSLARTLPSWTSVFTSTFPPDHRIRHMFPREKELKKRWVTLIDVLNQHDYYTVVTSDFAGDMFSSIDYGFQEVLAPDLTIRNVLKQRSQEFHYFLLGFILNPPGRLLFPEMAGMSLNKDPWYLTRAAKTSIKKAIKKNKPFFVLYFSSSNHFPYVTKYPYYKTYIPKNYYGKHKYGLSYDVLASFMEAEPDKDEIQHVISHYDNATKLFDDNLGEMLRFLKKCNIDKHTIVVVMSDHGENLCEENYGMAHGDHLLGPYANNMVLGIYSPFEDFQGRRLEKTVRDIDIAPTLLDLLKMKIPETFKGHSLVPVMRGADFPGYPAYLETGIWYTPTTPFIDNKIRLPYPHVVRMLEVEMPSGRVSLKEEFKQAVNHAKYKAYQLNEKKYIYRPGESTYQEEFHIKDKPVDNNNSSYHLLLSFKQKMVDMFKDKFHIDEKGFIREYITPPAPIPKKLSK
ncbi:MAG: sulfatase-like hydrolase/transferase [Candidatus Aminicenantes bacterium]|nr:MAG: sulfatase-like hydrolase/transferase [Candidatus Aminicenantes bacterium]